MTEENHFAPFRFNAAVRLRNQPTITDSRGPSVLATPKMVANRIESATASQRRQRTPTIPSNHSSAAPLRHRNRHLSFHPQPFLPSRLWADRYCSQIPECETKLKRRSAISIPSRTRDPPSFLPPSTSRVRWVQKSALRYAPSHNYRSGIANEDDECDTLNLQVEVEVRGLAAMAAAEGRKGSKCTKMTLGVGRRAARKGRRGQGTKTGAGGRTGIITADLRVMGAQTETACLPRCAWPPRPPTWICFCLTMG